MCDNKKVPFKGRLPFFLVFLSLSLSLPSAVWNRDAEPVLAFFLDLLALVVSSLSSLSDWAAGMDRGMPVMYV